MNKCQKAIYFILIIVLLTGLIGLGTTPSNDDQERLHPLLAQVASSYPEQRVSVIVQNDGTSDSAERLVADLGGTVTKDLHIINAFAAELPAKAAAELASASGVRWVSLDAPVVSAGKGGKGGDDGAGSDPPLPLNYFLDTLSVRQVWEMGLDGKGIAVAVVDSGVTNDKDFSRRRLVDQEKFNPDAVSIHDGYGHGTHVAGIIGGNGNDSNGLYVGVAPMVDLIGLKISGNDGMAYESDSVASLQWVLENKDKYNIRVVNLSVNSTVEQSYHTSPLDAAAEILWFNGIVVVVSAGNKGPGSGYNTVNAAPANDPFFITVGASDERGTPDPSDDIIAPFSAHGPTIDGYIKPDIIAPGQDIVSVLANTSSWHTITDRAVKIGNQSEYFRLSGTSMSAPMVTGAVALLLQDEPNLTPDQVKYRLINSSSNIGGTYSYLNVYAAVTATTTESANTGIEASQLLWSGDDPITWNSVNWNSVNWNSVNWNSVNWNSVSWGD